MYELVQGAFAEHCASARLRPRGWREGQRKGREPSPRVGAGEVLPRSRVQPSQEGGREGEEGSGQRGPAAAERATAGRLSKVSLEEPGAWPRKGEMWPCAADFTDSSHIIDVT